MKPRHKRLVLAGAAAAAVALAVGLILVAFESNIQLFFSPTQVVAGEAPLSRTFRIGGLVEQGSVKRAEDGVTVRFAVTDTARTIPVAYKGILPDLFKEGKGVVAQGRLEADGVFHASQVLAKHDENYMPPEAATALERARKAESESQKTLVMDRPAGGEAPK
ncbi:MAG: cytochrome c maturation protein CcmE [Betaproteobacteria bacterium]|jgi:cytochrome c-type biogenesis protein CcmE|nr:cytochrome c maturation protein CcmE [Rhodocyclaceae bacterium]MCA3133099.1 cytochrome c maturation protein CcmE [Rhodocyclaceae bacterium]MCA3141822.1 cytochrome c maturation protein CcmE [Rhodocyclaceae bacterium]MCA3144730.1 cytochrome c maturation protein CcmE [Rhodocyclaceae bacterium]MCE2896690.1 cytochrome c maturation protein CcmE [Betaproteobacteria bacterium]